MFVLSLQFVCFISIETSLTLPWMSGRILSITTLLIETNLPQNYPPRITPYQCLYTLSHNFYLIWLKKVLFYFSLNDAEMIASYNQQTDLFVCFPGNFTITYIGAWRNVVCSLLFNNFFSSPRNLFRTFSKLCLSCCTCLYVGQPSYRFSFLMTRTNCGNAETHKLNCLTYVFVCVNCSPVLNIYTFIFIYLNKNKWTQVLS